MNLNRCGASWDGITVAFIDWCCLQRHQARPSKHARTCVRNPFSLGRVIGLMGFSYFAEAYPRFNSVEILVQRYNI